MNKNLLKTGVEDFISNNLNADILSVLLKKSPFPEISSQELAQQLEGKQISQKKFPTLFNSPGILYPKKVHLEQASSEATALYKSALISGKTLLDITAGMGIDSLFFASQFEHVICCEKNEELAQITRHNMSQLGLDQIEVIQGDGLDVLTSGSKSFDCIYVDPSRRKEGKRHILLEDYEPDVLKSLDLLLANCKVLMIKTSPLLDIDQGIKQLRHVTTCHIVALRNEVKELIWILKPDFRGETLLRAVNIDSSEQYVFEFSPQEERDLEIGFGPPLSYLYEPNAAILKSGGFKSVAHQYRLKKLAANSHLYSSTQKIDFPGRIFRIENVQEFSKNWNKETGIQKANITTRNFSLIVAEIRRRFRIEDGGEIYLFFTTLSEGQRIVISCLKD